MVRQGPQLPLQRLPPLLLLQLLLRTAPRGRRLRPARLLVVQRVGRFSLLPPLPPAQQINAGIGRQTVQPGGKAAAPWKEASPRQALRNASWAASWASSRFPVILRHRV